MANAPASSASSGGCVIRSKVDFHFPSPAPVDNRSQVNQSTLEALGAGRVARVTGLAPADSGLVTRLLELGFDEGAHVELLHQAPLGDPIAVRVDGSVVALRRALARLILVADAQ